MLSRADSMLSGTDREVPQGDNGTVADAGRDIATEGICDNLG